MTQRGSMSIIAATGALLLLLAVPVVADAGVMLLSRSRAQTAADSAARAAVARQVAALGQSGSPQAAAREQAEANGARLIDCICRTGETVATVRVGISPRLWLPAWRGRVVTATAAAAVDDWVATYR